jgi:hypothetical protein
MEEMEGSSLLLPLVFGLLCVDSNLGHPGELRKQSGECAFQWDLLEKVWPKNAYHREGYGGDGYQAIVGCKNRSADLPKKFSTPKSNGIAIYFGG